MRAQRWDGLEVVMSAKRMHLRWSSVNIMLMRGWGKRLSVPPYWGTIYVCVSARATIGQEAARVHDFLAALLCVGVALWLGCGYRIKALSLFCPAPVSRPPA